MNETIVLEGIAWETYERLLEDLDAGGQHAHLTYDRGCLEIEMSPLPIHAERERFLSAVVEFLSEARDLDFRAGGDTTFRRPAVGRGGEPDSCFYFRNLESLPREIDASVYAPDLVIEVDITSPSVDKQGLYAAMNVTEIWHDNGQNVTILTLDSERGIYVSAGESLLFPRLDPATLTRFVEEGPAQRRSEWRRNLRAWARENQINGNL